jgi:hypothetical protein
VHGSVEQHWHLLCLKEQTAIASRLCVCAIVCMYSFAVCVWYEFQVVCLCFCECVWSLCTCSFFVFVLRMTLAIISCTSNVTVITSSMLLSVVCACGGCCEYVHVEMVGVVIGKLGRAR